jgi:hypothetical protein
VSRKRKNLTGQKFGDLTAVRISHIKEHRTFWICKCICGAQTTARLDGLKCGDYVSCGCKKITQLSTHGDTGSAEHKAWMSMIGRCHTPTAKDYPSYGGRGINVCDEWRTDYPAFLAHVGRKPEAHLSIDRIDNSKGYEPGNVRWATPLMQANNRRHPRPRKIQQ